MADAKKYYLVYHSYHGQVCCQTWWGEVTVNGKPMENILLKREITAEEFDSPLSFLMSKYPYKE